MRVGQGLCDYINKAYCFRFKTKEVIMKKQSTPGSRLPDSLNSGLSSFFSFLSCFLFFSLNFSVPEGGGREGVVTWVWLLAGYVPLASQNPYPIIVYSAAML